MKSNHKLALLCTLIVIMLGLFFKLIFTLSADMASASEPAIINTSSVIPPSESVATAPVPDSESQQSVKPVESQTPSPTPEKSDDVLPEGFVYICDVIPSAKLEIRYSTTHNFTGQIVPGYLSDHASLAVKAAEALKKASEVLKKEGYGIRIYDAYRPKQAVDFFVQWAQKPEDNKTKAEFYPDINKIDLIPLGYVAKKSGHSRGSTVDLTLFSLKTGKDLDMGSPFDFLGPISNQGTKLITAQQAENRNILKKAMLDAGFKEQKTEWWHFTLVKEPYPDKYFDFPVK